MKNFKLTFPRLFQVVLLLGVLAYIALSFLQWLQPPAEETPAVMGYASNTYRAEVLEIIEEGTSEVAGQMQPYQIASVRLLEGPYQGQRLEIDYGLRQVRPADQALQPGEQILVTVSSRPEGGVSAFFTDFIRTRSLLVLLLCFVIFSILISGWKAVRSLLGMAFSLVVIVGYIIPRILDGQDPVLVSVTGSFILLAVTLYLVYGWTLKTHAAVLGTFTALVITGLLATYFIDYTRLSGFGSEEAMFLVQQTGFTINMRGLLLGGLLIGALGVLDDLVITQASVVFELHHANPALRFRSLFGRAMTVGRDHVAATVNTLVLAYAGAALPMLLLFSLSGQAPDILFNLEFVADEVVRTLVGSLGLIAAVPLTTLLACAVALYHARLGWLGPLLGPEGEGHHH